MDLSGSPDLEKFNPYEFNEYLQETCGDLHEATVAYRGDSTELVHPDSVTELEEEMQEFLKESIAYHQSVDEAYRDRKTGNLRATMNIWEERCELVMLGKENTEGVVALLDKEARKGGKLDMFTVHARRALDGEL
jgi:hypothetical protein